MMMKMMMMMMMMMITSSCHFEKRKLGRVVSKLSLVDR